MKSYDELAHLNSGLNSEVSNLRSIEDSLKHQCNVLTEENSVLKSEIEHANTQLQNRETDIQYLE